MKCSKCGAELKENAVFCQECGEKVENNHQFCPECGNQVDGKMFCPFCGKKLDDDSSNHPMETDSKSNPLPNNRLIIIGIIAIILVLAAGFLISNNIANNDLVDVINVNMVLTQSYTPFGGAMYSVATENGEDVDYSDYQVLNANTEFSLMPKETITRVTGLELSNVVVTFEDGSSEDWGGYIYEPSNVYYANDVYDFQFSRTLDTNGTDIKDYNLISHISADVVINTTDETNKVIGHLDEDITLN